jgi:hypothetical protein
MIGTSVATSWENPRCAHGGVRSTTVKRAAFPVKPCNLVRRTHPRALAATSPLINLCFEWGDETLCIETARGEPFAYVSASITELAYEIAPMCRESRLASLPMPVVTSCARNVPPYAPWLRGAAAPALQGGYRAHAAWLRPGTMRVMRGASGVGAS